MKFHEYPKALRGPNGEIEIAPNATKEKALRAAGYEMPGQPSAEDFARAQNHIDRDRPVAEWPKYINGKIVHDPEAPPAVPEGEFPKYVAGRVVENREDEVALLAEGDAPAMPPAGRAGERAKLMRIAAGLGLKPQVTWGVARLREAVTEAQERRTAYPMAMRGPDGGIVNARDEGEEAALLTQGYECPGTPNPAAFAKDREQPAESEYREWPKYINGKIVHDPNAGPEFPKWVNGRRIENKAQELAVLACEGFLFGGGAL